MAGGGQRSGGVAAAPEAATHEKYDGSQSVACTMPSYVALRRSAGMEGEATNPRTLTPPSLVAQGSPCQ